MSRNLRYVSVCALLVVAASTTSSMQSGSSTRYVDGSLAVASCTTYSPASRSCSGGNAVAYQSLAGAAAAVRPGETVEIRGGTYNFSTGTSMNLAVSGTSSSRITYTGYQSEQVIFKGPYDVDSDGDGIRNMDESAGTDAAGVSGNAIMVNITGSYITFRRVTLNWGYHGLAISGGTGVIVEETKCHDMWDFCFTLENGADSNIFRYNVGYRTRHSSAFHVDVDSTAHVTLSDVWWRNLSFKNGRMTPNDAIVLPAGSDSVGGGNSDGFAFTKDCSDLVSGVSLCRDGVFQENMAWLNTDDCWDTSIANFHIINNIAYNCGPRGRKGFKMLRVQSGMTYSGNVVVGSNPPSSTNSIDRAYEPRFGDSASTNSRSMLAHNLGTRSGIQTLYIAALTDGSRCQARNNVMWGGSTEFTLTNDNQTCPSSANFNGDTSGTPDVANPGFDPASTMSAAESCVAQAPHARTVESCWQAAYNVVYNAYRPSAGSALIDAGAIVSGYHCARGDDAGQDPAAACRHWMGSAPDQGPFEAGISGNPDLTRCAATGACATESGSGGSGSAPPPAAPSNLRIVMSLVPAVGLLGMVLASVPARRKKVARSDSDQPRPRG